MVFSLDSTTGFSLYIVSAPVIRESSPSSAQHLRTNWPLQDSTAGTIPNRMARGPTKRLAFSARPGSPRAFCAGRASRRGGHQDRKLLRHSLGSYKDLAFFDKVGMDQKPNTWSPTRKKVTVGRRGTPVSVSKRKIQCTSNSGWLEAWNRGWRGSRLLNGVGRFDRELGTWRTPCQKNRSMHRNSNLEYLPSIQVHFHMRCPSGALARSTHPTVILGSLVDSSPPIFVGPAFASIRCRLSF